MFLDQAGRVREVAPEEVGLRGGQTEVGPDLLGDRRIRQMLRRRGDETRVLVEHEAALDVVAEVFAVLLGEDERLLEQLVGVERALEHEEEVGAQPLRLQVGRRQLRAGADVAGELGVVLAREGLLGDAHEVFAFAVEVSRSSVGILGGQQLRPLAETDLLLAEEEVRHGIGGRVGQVEVHVRPACRRDAVHESLLEVVGLGQRDPEQQQEDREEQADPAPVGAVAALFVADDFDRHRPQQDRIARARALPLAVDVVGVG